MKALNERDAVRRQYRDSSNFDARVRMHARYSTNTYGWNRWVFDHLELGPRAKVLEVGGGPCWLWRSCLDRVPPGWRVVATDMSPGMVGEARAAISDERFSFVVADVQALPFEDATFDAVVANHMLYHVPDLPGAVGELARVMVDDGRLIAATNGRRHMVELRGLVTAPDALHPHVEAFGLETGPALLQPAFHDVEVVRYEDALRVTEVQPVIDYLASMTSFWQLVERPDDLRAQVAETIEREGVFAIQKDAGLIRATRRS